MSLDAHTILVKPRWATSPLLADFPRGRLRFDAAAIADLTARGVAVNVAPIADAARAAANPAGAAALRRALRARPDGAALFVVAVAEGGGEGGWAEAMEWMNDVAREIGAPLSFVGSAGAFATLVQNLFVHGSSTAPMPRSIGSGQGGRVVAAAVEMLLEVPGILRIEALRAVNACGSVGALLSADNAKLQGLSGVGTRKGEMFKRVFQARLAAAPSLREAPPNHDVVAPSAALSRALQRLDQDEDD